MSTTTEPAFSPLVTGATTSQSPNVRSVMDCLDNQTYYIPEYQRDSSQWDIPKIAFHGIAHQQPDNTTAYRVS